MNRTYQTYNKVTNGSIEVETAQYPGIEKCERCYGIWICPGHNCNCKGTVLGHSVLKLEKIECPRVERLDEGWESHKNCDPTEFHVRCMVCAEPFTTDMRDHCRRKVIARNGPQQVTKNAEGDFVFPDVYSTLFVAPKKDDLVYKDDAVFKKIVPENGIYKIDKYQKPYKELHEELVSAFDRIDDIGGSTGGTFERQVVAEEAFELLNASKVIRKRVKEPQRKSLLTAVEKYIREKNLMQESEIKSMMDHIDAQQ